jgi:hypothetical protein
VGNGKCAYVVELDVGLEPENLVVGMSSCWMGKLGVLGSHLHNVEVLIPRHGLIFRLFSFVYVALMQTCS